jgi:hypothetical protein
MIREDRTVIVYELSDKDGMLDLKESFYWYGLFINNLSKYIINKNNDDN